jgi:hypothetical protein
LLRYDEAAKSWKDVAAVQTGSTLEAQVSSLGVFIAVSN